MDTICIFDAEIYMPINFVWDGVGLVQCQLQSGKISGHVNASPSRCGHSPLFYKKKKHGFVFSVIYKFISWCCVGTKLKTKHEKDLNVDSNYLKKWTQFHCQALHSKLFYFSPYCHRVIISPVISTQNVIFSYSESKMHSFCKSTLNRGRRIITVSVPR